ncbi:hypothetical protein UJ101_01664 [Flavobacteriaceae bacterium UJ101]|nr:hypothetical protein UJ101_01664 [Flavobacteriaceae bacterium UJ101]
MKKISILFISFFFINCSSSLHDYMIGKWESKYVDFHFQQADGLVNKFTVNFDNPEDENAKVKAFSEYNQDGTFTAHYQNEKGEKINPTKGTWQIIHDSLNIQYDSGSNRVNAFYKIVPTSYGFEAYSHYDFDHNGLVDTLFMKSKRLDKIK